MENNNSLVIGFRHYINDRDRKRDGFILEKIALIKNKKLKPNTKGSYSYCYFFGKQVILKNIVPFDVPKPDYGKEFEQDKTFINNVIDTYKINAPKLIGYLVGKHHYYRVEEKANGTVVSVSYPSTARAIAFKTGVLDGSSSKEELARENDIQPGEAEEIGKALYVYNVSMQKQLKNAHPDMFKKFVTDFKNLVNNGVSIDFFRSENFLFDKDTGFSFVDLEKQRGDIKPVADYEIGKMIYRALGDFKKFACHPYMNRAQIKTIEKNMNDVNYKLFEAMRSAKFNLSPQELAALDPTKNGLYVSYKKGKK